jgi:hypothetical protein
MTCWTVSIVRVRYAFILALNRHNHIENITSLKGGIFVVPQTELTKTIDEQEKLPLTIYEVDSLFQRKLPVMFKRTCQCKTNNLNCMTPKEWLKSQIGVWQFFYEGRDIRDKKIHPATFPISLAKKISPYLRMKVNWF